MSPFNLTTTVPCTRSQSSPTLPQTHRWFPCDTYPGNDPVTYCHLLGEVVFDYPFFNEGVDRLLEHAPNRQRLDLRTLAPLRQEDLLEVRGFIFHTSHCGSTLLGRMLNEDPEVRVVSETEAINGLLVSYVLGQISRAAVLHKISAVINAYRQPLGAARYLIFKMTSWNVFLADLFQELFPGVHWLYLDRETEAVVRSLSQSESGMVAWFHHPVDVLRRFFVGNHHELTTEQAFLRHLVEQHRRQAARFRNQHGCFLVYPDFIEQLESVILPHFGLSPSVAARQKMKGLREFDAKSGGKFPAL